MAGQHTCTLGGRRLGDRAVTTTEALLRDPWGRAWGSPSLVRRRQRTTPQSTWMCSLHHQTPRPGLVMWEASIHLPGGKTNMASDISATVFSPQRAVSTPLVIRSFLSFAFSYTLKKKKREKKTKERCWPHRHCSRLRLKLCFSSGCRERWPLLCQQAVSGKKGMENVRMFSSKLPKNPHLSITNEN